MYKEFMMKNLHKQDVDLLFSYASKQMTSLFIFNNTFYFPGEEDI